MLVAFPILDYAQSKHAALWHIGDYCLDFNSVSPIFYQFTFLNVASATTSSGKWYVDSKGKLSVIANYVENKMMVIDESTNAFDEIDSDYQYNDGFFVPMPDNEDQVYYIEHNRYFVVDLKQKTIVLKGSDIDMSIVNHIAVHHSDCDKVWIISPDKKVWTTYLLSSSGIKKMEETTLTETDYNAFPITDTENWEINLSKDCKHYTMTIFKAYSTEVYYGDFDRSTGVFSLKSRYNFGTDFLQICNSIIAPDNSRIYYLYNTSMRDVAMLEVPIINGLPDYSKQTHIYSNNGQLSLQYRPMLYGLDNKIYIIDNMYKKINTIEINENNETVFTDTKFTMPEGSNSLRNYFLSSWFMDNSCEEHSSPSISLPDVCTSQTKTYSVDNSEQGIVYYWEVAGGELSATTGSEVSVKWADTEGNGTLCVYSKHIETGCVSDKNVYSVKRKKSPTVEFDNASVCYGEPLKVMLSGTAPFEVFYTLDGETNSFKTDISEYQMDNIPGNYQLIKVTDGNACEASPTENNTAIIVPKLQKLIIKELK